MVLCTNIKCTAKNPYFLPSHEAENIIQKLFKFYINKNELKETMQFPDQINIETVHGCNADCLFCQAGTKVSKLEKNYRRRMTEDIFEELCLQLRDISFSGRISLHVNNEPLLDDHLAKRIHGLRLSCPKSIIRVMTNGILLRENIADSLFEAGLDLLDINNYHDSEKILFLTGQLMRKWGEKKVRKFKRKWNASLFNRAGSSPLCLSNHKYSYVFTGCHYPFTQITVSFMGQVGLCCHDYYFAGEAGNIMEQHLKTIWNNNRFKKVRKNLLNLQRSGLLCELCDYPGVPRDVELFENQGVKITAAFFYPVD